MAKILIEQIREELSQNNWQLVSEEYTNLDTEMTYICPEGHKVFAPWKKMRGHQECPICKANKLYDLPKEIRPKTKGAKRTIALDQATHITGYAVFDDDKLIYYGTYKTSADDEIIRIANVRNWLISMVNSWSPDYIVIEGIQYQDESSGQKMGVTVFQTLARLQGVLMLTCHEAKISFEVCPTNTWRHGCGVKGRSRADRKRSMQMLVKQWYDVKVTDDESDAIGIGYYYTKRLQKNTTTTNWEI